MNDKELRIYLAKKLPILQNKRLNIEKSIKEILNEQQSLEQNIKSRQTSEKSEILELQNRIDDIRANLKNDF